MTPALILLAYAGALAWLGPRLLGGGWSSRSPRLAIVAWQCLTVSILAAVTLAGLALVIPNFAVGADLAALLRACVIALRAHYATPGGALTGAAGAILAIGVVTRTAWCLSDVMIRSTRTRARHRRALTIIGSTDAGIGAVVIKHDEPAVYCLPGRHHHIVVTTGALHRLDASQLAAVLGHEHAHASGRHDLVLAWSQAVTRAFPHFPVFARAHQQTGRLIELLADDVATTHGADRLTLAEALMTLSGSPTPSAALGAGGSTAAFRVRRLITPPQPLGPARGACVAASLTGLTALPLIIATAPAAAAAAMHYCPL